MNRICFHFQISQPYRLRTYRFFDINERHDYFDDYQNHYLTNRLAGRCYLPANRMMMELIRQFPDRFRLSFSIAGSSIRLFQQYCPAVVDSFRELSATGQVEITGNTYTHSIASLHGEEAFMEQVRLQEELLLKTFGIRPVSFCNTEAFYSDETGEWLGNAGYKVVLTEGARHILGWKSPCYLYCNPYQTDVRLLLRSCRVCDDITLRFGDRNWDQYPLTAEKYIGFLDHARTECESPLLNLYWDYETIGEHYTEDTGIFDFFRALISQLAERDDYTFITPKDIPDLDLPVATMHAPWPISCSGEEKDVNEWIGNELQQEAFRQLFGLEELYRHSHDAEARDSWLQLQAADHFNFMASKWFRCNSVFRNFEVYSSPYQAFINYMNVLNDVRIRLEESQPPKQKRIE